MGALGSFCSGIAALHIHQLKKQKGESGEEEKERAEEERGGREKQGKQEPVKYGRWIRLNWVIFVLLCVFLLWVGPVQRKKEYTAQIFKAREQLAADYFKYSLGSLIGAVTQFQSSIVASEGDGYDQGLFIDHLLANLASLTDSFESFYYTLALALEVLETENVTDYIQTLRGIATEGKNSIRTQYKYWNTYRARRPREIILFQRNSPSLQLLHDELDHTREKLERERSNL